MKQKQSKPLVLCGLSLALSAKSQNRKSTDFRFVLSPLRLRSVPDRPHRTSKKQKKVKHFVFIVYVKSRCPLFSVFCLRRLKRAETDRSRGIKGKRESIRLTGLALSQRRAPWASNKASGFYGFCQQKLLIFQQTRITHYQSPRTARR